MRHFAPLAALLIGGCATLASVPDAAHRPEASDTPAAPLRTLRLIHVSDLEASLAADPRAAAGGVERFVRLFHALRADSPHPTLAVVAGDAFMPGPGMEVQVGGENAVDVANRLPGFDVAALGNHEFDLGPAFLADRIRASGHPWLSATVTPVDPELAALAVEMGQASTPWLADHPGRLLPRGLHCAGGTLVGAGSHRRCTGEVVGVIGATTELLAQISARATGVDLPADFDELRRRVQVQADALAAEGIDRVILLSHLQDVRRDVQLVEDGLIGVDVIVSGGGDDRLAAPEHLLAGDVPHALCDGEASCYPLIRTAADGRPVAIVATDGQMRYVGGLDLAFDEQGAIAAVLPGSRPWPAHDTSLQALQAPPAPEAAALEMAVRTALASEDEAIAWAAVPLDGRREAVRNAETNLGGLAADALAWAAGELRPDLPVAFGLRNGGGIRASLGAGPISRVDIREAFRFDDPIVIVRTTRQVLVETLESALRGAGTGRGQFPQLGAGLSLTWDPAGQEQTHHVEDGVVVAIDRPGGRVLQLSIGDEPVVVDGRLIDPDAEVRFATVAFLAAGGDGWFPGAGDRIEVLPLGLGERAAFEGYLRALVQTGSWQEGRPFGVPAGRLAAVTDQ